MQFLNEGFFLWRENKIQTHMALCEKVLDQKDTSFEVL